jgi:hypothetical protein
MVQANAKGVLFTEALARRIDDDKPIGIGILTKPEVGSALGDERSHLRQIFRQGFGGMAEVPIR